MKLTLRNGVHMKLQLQLLRRKCGTAQSPPSTRPALIPPPPMPQCTYLGVHMKLTNAHAECTYEVCAGGMGVHMKFAVDRWYH